MSKLYFNLVLEFGGRLVHSGAREVDRRTTNRRARLASGRRRGGAHRLVEALVHRRAAVVRELVLLRAVQLAQQRVLLVHPQALLLPRYPRYEYKSKVRKRKKHL